MSAPIINTKSHSQTKNSLEETSDEEETITTYAEDKNFSDSQTDESITHNSSHTEAMSRPSEKEPIGKNLHFHFELITEPSNPTEETKPNEDTFAEEHFNNTEIESTDQSRQANLQKSFPLDKEESALNFVADCPNLFNHDEPIKRENEFK